MRRTIISVALAACALLVFSAAPSSARTSQEGLVNVNIEDVNVQVPVSVAAAICDVNVAALTTLFNDDAPASCDATAESLATNNGPRSNSPADQQGLVNVNLQGVNIQVPVGIAAVICDLDVAALVGTFLDDAPRSCDAATTVDAG